MAQDFLEPAIPAQPMRRAPPILGGVRIAPALPLAVVLVAAALALIAALRTLPPAMLDVGAQGDSRFATEMLRRERDPASGITFRWTEPWARLWLHGAEFQPTALSLHIYNQEALAGRRELRLDRGERSLGSLRLAEGWRIYRVLVPGAADAAPLALATDPITTPGDAQGRGVPLDWARIEPLAAPAPPWRALLLAWGLAALAGWLWLLDRALFAAWPGGRGLRIAALIAAIAAGMALWARADPYALARDLPPMPWSFQSPRRRSLHR
jgi:hypothetical protein